jgi:hypothetical protein
MATPECANKASTNAVIDPVCRMEVIPGLSRLATMYQGRGIGSARKIVSQTLK